MADLRKIFYASAMATLLAGLSAPAYAQGTVDCRATGNNSTFMRTEGHAELIGDILVRCTGGTPTAPGNKVPIVNIRLTLSTNITSQLLNTSTTAGPGSFWNEILLLVDEPNSGNYGLQSEYIAGQTGPRGLLACGGSGAPDNSASGLNVCEITATNHPSRTYDGTPNGFYLTAGDQNTTCTGGESGTPAAGSFGCGRPNVFQARTVAGSSNQVDFLGVPFDPPGLAKYRSASSSPTPWERTFRIVNVRTDANAFFLGANFNSQTSAVFADLIFTGNTQGGTISNATGIEVGRAANGLLPVTASGTASFVQCIARTNDDLTGISLVAGDLSNTAASFPKSFIRFTEGFASSWKTKGWEFDQSNSIPTDHRIYDGPDSAANDSTGASFDTPTVIVRQNYPGGTYFTESGFTAPGFTNTANASENPPIGVATAANDPSLAQTFSNSTGIENAGIATNGTRLQIAFAGVPNGVTVYTPAVVYLTRATTNVITGVAIRNLNVDPNRGPLSPPSSPLATSWVAVGTGAGAGIAVYEVIFALHSAQEQLTVPISVTTDLSQIPQTITTTTTVRGGFAPSYTSGANVAQTVSAAAGKLPRFFENITGGGTAIFTIDKCGCNLLFPFVSTVTPFDTGIAIANTSRSPSSTFLPVAIRDSIFVNTLAQDGPVQFWYFQNGAVPTSECTNLNTKGACPSPTVVGGTVTATQIAASQVKAGEVLTTSLVNGSAKWGLNGPGKEFQGYMIAKAGFQYCHGFAFVSNDGLRILGTHPPSVGYLALVMDNGSKLPRTTIPVDSLDN